MLEAEHACKSLAAIKVAKRLFDTLVTWLPVPLVEGHNGFFQISIANERLRRTRLHISSTTKSNFDNPVFEIRCSWLSALRAEKHGRPRILIFRT